MHDNCYRKQIEGLQLFNMDIGIDLLSLLCCNVCKKIENKEELNKYEKLYVFPLTMSFRRDEPIFMRVVGCTILEDTALEFGNADSKQMEEFFSLLSRVADGKARYSHKDLLKLSEGTYLQVVARLYYAEKNDLMRFMAMQYIENNALIRGSNVRSNWYHKDNDNPFFIIGVGLDEGIIESMTCEMMSFKKEKSLSLIEKTKETELTDSKTDETISSLNFDFIAKQSDAYFFEMKFVDKIIKTFKFDRREFLAKSLLKPDFLRFLSEETKKKDYCDFYDLLALSDRQKWKEVFSILKKYER